MVTSFPIIIIIKFNELQTFFFSKFILFHLSRPLCSDFLFSFITFKHSHSLSSSASLQSFHTGYFVIPVFFQSFHSNQLFSHCFFMLKLNFFYNIYCGYITNKQTNKKNDNNNNRSIDKKFQIFLFIYYGFFKLVLIFFLIK